MINMHVEIVRKDGHVTTIVEGTKEQFYACALMLLATVCQREELEYDERKEIAKSVKKFLLSPKREVMEDDPIGDMHKELERLDYEDLQDSFGSVSEDMIRQALRNLSRMVVSDPKLREWRKRRLNELRKDDCDCEHCNSLRSFLESIPTD